jgi:transcriptional regulator with XRE-family HTH domain
MFIHERIKQVRSAVGLSQAKFAKRMAISSSYLAEIELNNKTASERMQRLLVSEFNVNGEWLRTGNGEMFNHGMDAQLSRITGLFNSFNQHFKSCAVIQMEALADLQVQLDAIGYRGCK